MTLEYLKDGTAPAKKTADSTDTELTLSFDGEGKTTFALAHGEKLTVLNLLHNREYSLLEAGEDGYTAVSSLITESETTSGDSLIKGQTLGLENTIEFTNTYFAEGEAQIGAAKAVNRNEVWEKVPEGFVFLLTPKEGAPMRVKASADDAPETKTQLEAAVTQAAPAAAFSKLYFSNEDIGQTYAYTLREVIPDEANNNVLHGITYDAAEITVTVEVKDKGNGTLTFDVLYNGEAGATFTNRYETLSVSGSKTWIDGDKEHDNAEEVLLTLTRTSAKEGSAEETVADVTPVWDGANYTFADLPAYDESDAAYTYSVNEARAEGYGEPVMESPEANVFNFTNRKQYTITFDPNGGTLAGSTAPVSSTHEHGEVIAIREAPTRDQYVFLYWKGSEYQPGDAYTVTQDHTFVAQWKEKNPYTFRFSFTKEWVGGAERGIDWTFFNPNGSENTRKFNKRMQSKDQWSYEVWLEGEGDYYLIEKPMPGYATKYVNVGKYANITDRCMNGGKIINQKIPRTGDAERPWLWFCLATISLAGICFTVSVSRKKKERY